MNPRTGGLVLTRASHNNHCKVKSAVSTIERGTRRCVFVFRKKEQVVKKLFFVTMMLFSGAGLLLACTGRKPTAQAGSLPRLLAVETFLADMAQNVAGERLKVGSLMPIGLDPHAFQPTPSDVAKIADSQVLIVNGAGLETWLDETLQNAGGKRAVVEASTGLQPRTPSASEQVDEAQDPHFWLDPISAIRYVENIRAGLIQADPEGKAVYTQNAETYIASLRDLDAWIRGQVEQIPEDQRLLVTNHESFGYFADRYGFKVVGTVLPSVSTGAAPSAEQMAALIETIRSSGVKAIFLETGADQRLADQIAKETGVKVITGLYSHSITEPGGAAPTYIDMIKYNTQLIVDALK
jgi:ABC-type Zn uptake system ZnuABC Zn-binding protein ZnuA